MKIFVYGTLKSNEVRSLSSWDGPVFLGETATTSDYKLYSSAAFPCMVRSPNGISIYGELWEVTKDNLVDLDRIEGHPSLFKRTKIYLIDGQLVETYLYQHSIYGFRDCGNHWTSKSVKTPLLVR